MAVRTKTPSQTPDAAAPTGEDDPAALARGARAARPAAGRRGATAPLAPAPTTGTRADTAADELEVALTRVARAVLRLGVPAEALRQGEHIDRSGYWVLFRLDESGGALRLSDLAGLLELDLSTVSRQVRQLVDAGLVTRESDPVDGRACLLGLSERGHSVLDAVREARRAVLRQALGGWHGAERAAIAGSLARLADDLHTGPGRR